MRNSRYRYSRLVMIIGAVAFGLNALILLFWPDRFARYIGVVDVNNQATDLERWSFQLMGLILIALAVHMSSTSRHAPDGVFQRAAIVMIFISSGLSYLTFLAPGTKDSGRWVFVAIGGLFALLYIITLPIKSIGIQADEISAE